MGVLQSSLVHCKMMAVTVSLHRHKSASRETKRHYGGMKSLDFSILSLQENSHALSGKANKTFASSNIGHSKLL